MNMQTYDEDLLAPVEARDGICVIRGGGGTRGWNGITYKTGLSGKNVNAHELSMNVATIPPGGVAAAHIHVDFEVMLYILEGRVRHEYGEGLTERVDHRAGDFIFIAPGVPHEVFNLSDTEPVVAVVARSSADEWDRIVAYKKDGRRKKEDGKPEDGKPEEGRPQEGRPQEGRLQEGGPQEGRPQEGRPQEEGPEEGRRKED